MSVELKRWLRYLALLIMVLFLCWQNKTSSENINNGVSHGVSAVMNFFGGNTTAGQIYFMVRKSGHFVAFLALGLLGHLAISGDATTTKSAIACSLSVNMAIALLAEITQAYASGRTATFRDALINMSGSAIGILIGIIIEFAREKTKRH